MYWVFKRFNSNRMKPLLRGPVYIFLFLIVFVFLGCVLVLYMFFLLRFSLCGFVDRGCDCCVHGFFSFEYERVYGCSVGETNIQYVYG